MRNLSVLSSTAYALPAGYDGHIISAITTDVEDAFFAASERINSDGVNIQVWKVDEHDRLRPLSDVTSPAVSGASAQIVSLTVIADTRTLCLITRSGDIAILPLENDTEIDADVSQSLDIVGTLTPGTVLAAAAAPDSSLLVIITSASASVPSTPSPTLHLMSSTTFTLLSSVPLSTSHRGASAPIALGWGSKSTQFHGSLGKSAAHSQSTAESGCTTTPDDDGVPRVSWRGDAQFFVVSAVELEDGVPGVGKRVVRVYNRAGVLQSTTEDVPGLEHGLAWRPSGGLIAGVQRFGVVPRWDGASGEVGGGDIGDKAWALGKGVDGRHDVVFFERNGLRHGEFLLRESGGRIRSSGLSVSAKPIIVPSRRWGYKVRELGWNADSSVLSVWLERETRDVVQLWTTGNYHWYLKIEVPAPGAGRFTTVTWHTEDPSRLFLSTTDTLLATRYTVSTASSPSSCGTGLVGVIDGDALLLTPFRTQNVPPPMSSARLSLSSSLHLHTTPVQPPAQPSPPPVSIAFAPHSGDRDEYDILATLLTSCTIALWKICIPLAVKKGSRDGVMSTLLWRGDVEEVEWARQVCVREGRGEEEWVVGVLGEGRRGEKWDVIRFIALVPAASAPSSALPYSAEVDVEPGLGFTSLLRVAHTWEVYMPGRGGRMVENEGSGKGEVVWQARDGGLWEGAILSAQLACVPGSGSLSPFHSIFIGLSASKLHIAHSDPTFPPHILSQACTSYAIAGPYLIWTATAPAHEAVFARLGGLYDALHPPGVQRVNDSTFEKRRIERGARIVTVVPSTMTLVLQMPRGNLETVMPRPLVMEQVRADVQRGDYRAAFLACRKHRVDLNVLVELDPGAFVGSIASFVEQLNDVDYINLFLSGLGPSSLPRETVSRLCDGIREELELRDGKRFVNSILTAHVVKTPPDYEAGLSLLLRLRETDPGIIDEAVKYIIFLVDADRLFDTALGMYDFSLVLLVAQYSQKDPREYLPFLRALRALDGAYQRFKIDDHLGRHEKALRSLHGAGTARFEEAKAYVEKHGLYQDGLDIWRGERGAYNAMLEVYGDHLFERRDFRAAAWAFVQASRIRKAMAAYEKALDWQELFDLVVREGITGDKMAIIARRVASELGAKQRYVEAARVLLDYADDVDEAVTSLVNGNAWSEARRVAALRQRADLVTLLIHPGTLAARASLSDEVVEIRDLLDKQVGRLDELSVKKLGEPEAYYGADDAYLANVDVMTDVSNPGTAFTRYTVAPTSSDRSRRTSRSKRKLDRKAGRKGTVEEEEYLLQSLVKLVGRFEGVQAECRALLPHLVVLSDEHACEASDLQGEVEELEQAMRGGVERVWTERQTAVADDQGPDASEGVGEGGKGRVTDKVPRPNVADLPWKVGWIGTGKGRG